jgi:cytochrome c-type biogenesis protein CcmH
MMSDFWIMSLGLILLALLILVVPAFFTNQRIKQTQASIDRTALNVAVYKDRIKELKHEQEEGILSEEQYQRLSSELQASLLEDVKGLEQEEKVSSQASDNRLAGSTRVLKGVVVALVVIIPLFSYSLYGKLGAYDQLDQFRTLDAAMIAKHKGMPQKDIDQLLANLKSRLMEDPDNPKNMEGWFMLARSSMQVQNYGEAADAFMKLGSLLTKNKQDASYIYGYAAQARYYESKGVMTDQVKEAINKALAANPDEVNSLGLLGMNDFQTQQYESAIKHWSRILEVQPDNPSRKSIVAGLKMAQKKLKEQGKTVDIPVLDKAQAVSKASITVTVDISDALKAKVKPDDMLFVFAKAVKGPPMPLAVSRKHVSDLPLTVTLDDSMAMSPMLKLSSVPRVNIVARVSKSGKPIASAGDMEGMVKDISTSKPEKVNVVIDKAL